MINKFFFSGNQVDKLSEIDYNQLSTYQEVLQAFSRTTYSSLYIIDYEKKEFEYVSDNPLFLCGHSAEDVKQMGYDFYFNYVTAEDLELLVNINRIGFELFEQIPIHERAHYTLSYDFYMKSDKTKKILVHHKITPIFLTETGKLWKAMCMVSLSSEKTSGNIRLSKKGDSKILQYDLSENRWKTSKTITLSDREREILQLSIRGFTINEIASETFVSPETIKFHRKKLFNKIKVSNMSEAIFYAANNKLI